MIKVGGRPPSTSGLVGGDMAQRRQAFFFLFGGPVLQMGPRVSRMRPLGGPLQPTIFRSLDTVVLVLVLQIWMQLTMLLLLLTAIFIEI